MKVPKDEYKKLSTIIDIFMNYTYSLYEDEIMKLFNQYLNNGFPSLLVMEIQVKNLAKDLLGKKSSQ